MKIFRLSNIKWKYKIACLVLVPNLVAIFVLATFAFTASKQSNDVLNLSSVTNRHQHQSAKTMSEILKFQTAIQQLIASDDKVDIRKSAIAAIKAASLVDENTQLLVEKLGQNSKAADLQKALAAIKPAQLKIIKLAQKNQDQEAIQEFTKVKDRIDLIGLLSWNILQAEQEKLPQKVKEYHDKNNNLVITISIAVGIAVLATLTLAAFLGRTLIHSLNQFEVSMNLFADGHCDISLSYDGDDEIGATIKSFRKALGETNESVKTMRDESLMLTSFSKSILEISELEMKQSSSVAKEVARVSLNTQNLVETSNEIKELLTETLTDSENAAES